MTHDELLARINANLCGKDGCDGEHYKKDNLNGEWFALRAVVELHKPTDPKKINYVSYIEVNKMCSQCRVFYPCPTIQAIEKELK